MKDWTKMNDSDKLKLFSDVFTKAATDLKFRERLLASESSAIAAVAGAFDVEFPRDFSFAFIDEHESQEETHRAILRLPKFAGEGAKFTQPVPADNSNVLCTYPWWDQSKRNPERAPDKTAKV
jgi:hypothetical protein